MGDENGTVFKRLAKHANPSRRLHRHVWLKLQLFELLGRITATQGIRETCTRHTSRAQLAFSAPTPAGKRHCRSLPWPVRRTLHIHTRCRMAARCGRRLAVVVRAANIRITNSAARTEQEAMHYRSWHHGHSQPRHSGYYVHSESLKKLCAVWCSSIVACLWEWSFGYLFETLIVSNLSRSPSL